jgi:flagellar FliL protein
LLALELLHLLIEEVCLLKRSLVVAEEKAKEAAPAAPAAPEPASGQKPTLFIGLAVFNIVVVLGVGAMLFMGKKKAEQTASIEQVVEGEKKEQAKEAEEDPFVGEFIPMETFFVNLAGSRGGKIARVTMELEVEENNKEIVQEIERRKPQIRDIIIILLSSKTFDQVSTKEGKDNLREEIKSRLNSFLTKGKIKSILFTEFLLS